MGFFDKLKKINICSSFGSELTDDFYDELEESLILADTGMDTALELVEELRRRVKEEHIKTVEEARSCMCRCIADALNAGEVSLNLSTFLLFPVAANLSGGISDANAQALLESRKKEIIALIKSRLYGE